MRLKQVYGKAVLALVLMAIGVGLMAAAPVAKPPATDDAVMKLMQVGEPLMGAEGIPGFTAPSEMRRLSLRYSEIVKKVHVKAGDRVDQGAVLLEERDDEEQAKRAITQYLADLDVAIRAAEKMHEYKVAKFERYREMKKEGVANEQEFEEARLDAEVAKLEIEKAKADREQKQMEIKLQDAVLGGMRIVAPFAGIVQEVTLKEGEVVDPKQAITLVKIDPLWVEVSIPTKESLKLKLGQELRVFCEETGETCGGKVIFKDPVANSAAREQNVRLEIPNPQAMPAGLNVRVYLPTAQASAKD